MFVLGLALLAGCAWFAWRQQVQSGRNHALSDARAAVARGAPKEALERLAPFVDAKTREQDPLLMAWRDARRQWTAALVLQKQFAAARSALEAETQLSGSLRRGYRVLAADAGDIDRAEAVELAATGQTDRAVALFLKLDDAKRAMEALAVGRRFAEAAEIAASKVREGKLARTLWSQAGAAAVVTEDWRAAAMYFEKSERWEDAIEAYIKARQFSEARSLAARKISEPAELGRIAAATGDWAGAAEQFERANLRDAAADAYARAGAWREVAFMFRDDPEGAVLLYEKLEEWERAGNEYNRLSQPAKAGEAFERAEKWGRAGAAWSLAGESARAAAAYERGRLWQDAGHAWMKANKPDQAKEVLGRVIHDHLARAEYGSANRVLESTDRALRRELVELCRQAFDAERQSAHLAAFLVAGEVWSEAAGIYEKMGALRPAADAWRRAGDKSATARVMVLAAKAEPDVALALQAAEACLAAEDKAACTQMLELGLRQAMAQQRPILIAEVYRVWKRDIEGAEALITLAESWAGMHDQEALEALVAASSLLPKSTIFANIKELFKRAEALSARLSESLRRFPQIPEGGARYVNYFSATTRFDHTSASLTLVNRSDQLIRRVVVVLELFEKAPELYFGENDKAANADALRSSLSRWLWREQATLDAFAMSKPEFVSREVVANLSRGETRTLNLRLNNRVPYRRVRTRFEELDVSR